MSPNQEGLSLIEATIALFLLGVLLAGMVPSFLAFTDINTSNEIRTGAAQAAQIEMEALRSLDLSLVPTSTGVWSTNTVTVGGRDFDVEVRRCTVTTLCNADTRHFVVEVKLDARTYYTAETVFTTVL